MSHNNDIFDLLSSPQPAAQQNAPQTLQFNLTTQPAAASAGTNLSDLSNMFSGGFPNSTANSSLPTSPFSSGTPAGQMTGAFPANLSPNMSSSNANQFSGLAGLQLPSANQTAFAGSSSLPVSPFGPTGQQPLTTLGSTNQLNASLFSSNSQQDTSIFGQTPQQQPLSPFGQMQNGQNNQQPSSPFGQMQSGQNNQQPTSSFGQMQSGQNNQQTSSPFGQMQSGQNIQQPTSPFGQMQSGQNNQEPMSPFGQMQSGQNNQQTSSPFGQMQSGQNNQQPSSPFGQMQSGQNSQQPSSPFEQMQSGQNNQQPTSPFGQMQSGQNNQQPSSPFGQMQSGQNIQQPSSPFGQMQSGQNIQQPTSPFGQMQSGQNIQQPTSPFGQMQSGQNNQQPTSPFGQMQSGQNNQQTSSPFGQMQSGKNIQQPTSPFGQMQSGQDIQQPTSPFGQMQSGQNNQQTSSPFGQMQSGKNIQQPTSPFGQMQSGQNNQQPSSPFGQSSQQMGSVFDAFPSTSPTPVNPSQVGANNLDFGGFPSMANTTQPTIPVAAAVMTQASSSESFFGAFSSTSNTTSNAGWADQNIFGNATTGNQNSNAVLSTGSTGRSDDFFAAFSSPSTNANAASTSTALSSSSSSAFDDTFLSAFSMSTTVVSKPAPSTDFDAFSMPTPQQTAATNAPSNITPSADDFLFDPFGLSANPPNATAQQEAKVEPLFDAFSSPSSTPAASSDWTDAPEVQEVAKADSFDDIQREEIVMTESEPVEVNEENAAPKPIEKPGDEISDPVLREIHNKFGGRWKLTRSDPYDEFLKSVGIGLVHRKRAGKGSPEQVLSIRDGLIYVNIRSTFHSQVYAFKLNDETENVVEKVPQSVFCSYSNGKLFLQMTPVGDTFGKTQEVERSINDNNEQVVIYSAGIASCRRYFVRVDQPTSKTTATPTPAPTAVSKTSNSSAPQQETKAAAILQSTPAQEASRNQEVQKPAITEAPSNQQQPPVATIAAPALVFEVHSPPAAQASPPKTPGQLLLQNLQDEVSDDVPGKLEIVANIVQEDKLVFSLDDSIPQESEA